MEHRTMDQFYIDLANWVKSIEVEGARQTSEDWWIYIMASTEEMQRRYPNELAHNVIAVHVNYLRNQNPDGLPF